MSIYVQSALMLVDTNKTPKKVTLIQEKRSDDIILL